MAKIKAPNKEYAGISAGVPFTKGEANTDDPHLIEWFKTHGYEVVEGKKSKDEGKKAEKAPEPDTAEAVPDPDPEGEKEEPEKKRKVGKE